MTDAIRRTTLKPGFLVSLKTAIVGGVNYVKNTIEEDHIEGDGALKGRWETERTVFDPAEHEEAVRIRGRCRTVVTAICAHSDFGLLCPETSYDRLTAAVAEARALAADFNMRATRSNIQVYVVSGRVAQDDVEASRAISGEVRDLIESMERGLKNLDVKTVRDAANRARNLGSMLSPEAAERVKDVIAAARSGARAIVKAGEEGAAEIDQATLRKLAASRTAFLDIEEGDHLVAEPETVGRAIDLVPEEPKGVDDAIIDPTWGGTVKAPPALDIDDSDDDLPVIPARTPVSIDLD